MSSFSKKMCTVVKHRAKRAVPPHDGGEKFFLTKFILFMILNAHKKKMEKLSRRAADFLVLARGFYH
jgi:hypothetical protein